MKRSILVLMLLGAGFASAQDIFTVMDTINKGMSHAGYTDAAKEFTYNFIYKPSWAKTKSKLTKQLKRKRRGLTPIMYAATLANGTELMGPLLKHLGVNRNNLDSMAKSLLSQKYITSKSVASQYTAANCLRFLQGKNQNSGYCTSFLNKTPTCPYTACYKKPKS